MRLKFLSFQSIRILIILNYKLKTMNTTSMQKVKGNIKRKGIFKIPKVGALCSIVFLVAFSTVSSAQETINIGAVYFAQTHLSEPTETYFTLVSDRKALIKAHITHADQIGSPVVKAIVTVDGLETEIILTGPANLPVSFDPDIYTIQHSYDDGSFTGFIPKELVKPGMTVKIIADTENKIFDDLTIGAPTVLRMNYFKFACIYDTYNADSEPNWEAEFQARIPVSKLDPTIIKSFFPEICVEPKIGEAPARRYDAADWDAGDKYTKGYRFAVQCASSLLKAAGTEGRVNGSHFLSYVAWGTLKSPLAVGGSFKACGRMGGIGYIFHECGHALGLPHSSVNSHPYKAGTYGGIVQTKDWNGPNWGFCEWNEKFMGPQFQNDDGTWKMKRSPMGGGGEGANEDWTNLKYFSDYEVWKMKKNLERHIVEWDATEQKWGSWDTLTNGYTNYRENNGVQYSLDGYSDVYSVLINVNPPTPAGNFIYPPVGPYESGVIRLFDPSNAQDRTDISNVYSEHIGGFDYTLKITQDSKVTYGMIPIAYDATLDPLDKKFFTTYAVNVKESDGVITKVELLLTPDAEVNGLPTEETIITDWPETTSYNPNPEPEPEPTDFLVIDTPEELIWLSSTDLDIDNDGTDDFADIDQKMAANYLLGADIVFAEDETTVDWNNDGTVDANDATGLLSIGIDTKYTGHFDGQYYTIQNAFQNASKIGLFHQVNGATIEKLKLVDFDFTCNSNEGGGIVGTAIGVANVFHQLLAAGSLDYASSGSANLAVGGVVGSMINATVTECVAIVSYLGIDTVNRGKNAAGLIGKDEGGSKITNSYSVSTLYGGGKEIGGLLGKAKGVLDIKNSYSASSVTNSYVDFTEYGSFAGRLGTATVVSSYFDSEIQADGIGVGTGDNAADVIGLTTAEFNNQSKFVGWDFDAIWNMGTVDGVTRPVLKWQDLDGGNLSVAKISLGSLLKVYPNPVTSPLTIENAPVNATFSLTNSVGQEQISGTIEGTSKQLNVESYSKGIYILRVGNQTSKIIIE